MAKKARIEDLPLRLSDVPRYREQEEKLEGLRKRMADLDQQIRETWKNIQPKNQTAAAEALLDGDEGVLDGTSPTGSAARVALDELHDRKRIVEQAIHLQEQRLRDLRTDVSREICEPLRPYYAELVKDLAVKLQEAAIAVQREAEFREVLTEGNVSFPTFIRPCGPGQALSQGLEPKSNESALRRFLREAAEEYGVEPLPELPQVLPFRVPGTPTAKRPSARERFAALVSTITGGRARAA